MKLLTGLINSAILFRTAPHWAGGFGSPNIPGAEVVRRQVHSFFYALTVMVGGVLGGCKACRSQGPVYQPDTSSTALSLVAPFGGLKQKPLESIMTNQSRNTSVVHVDNIDIPVTEYQDQRVITTELMAQAYGTEINNIQANFVRNKVRFEEGKHYFKLEGKRLTDLKSVSPQINKRSRNLILWTERGAARHAKMLDTHQAWDVFDKLEAAYFEPPKPKLSLIESFRTRILVSIEKGETTQQVVPYGSCIVNPDDPIAVATFIREFVPSSPQMLSALSSAYITKLMDCQDSAIKSLKNR